MLVIATTHTQARYALPKVVARFKQALPRVRLSLNQGNPQQVADMVLAGVADVGIATEALDGYPELLALPGYRWYHCAVVPDEHPLLAAAPVTLEALARHPIVTYDQAFTGRSRIDAAFAARGIVPEIVLLAIDSDVIKTYVELGMGVGIIARLAFDPVRDVRLRMLDVQHLFGANTTRIAIARGRRLRGFAYRFIEAFAPQLSRDAVDRALAGGAVDYEL